MSQVQAPSRKIIKVIILFLVLAMVIQSIRIARDAGVFRSIDTEQMFGECSVVPGPVGPEDITIDPHNQVAYISADDRRAAFLGLAKQGYDNGGIWTLDLTKPDSEPVPLKIKMKGAFHPHGIALRFGQEGTDKENQVIEIYVVNHLDMQTHEINVLSVQADGSLKLRRTIEFPELISPNDIAVVGKDQFYVTNDHGNPRQTLMELVEDYTGLPLASVVYFDGEKASTVIEGVRYANGVTLSKDGKELYVAQTTAGLVSKYIKGPDGSSWHEVSNVHLPMAVDNLEWVGQQYILVGGHPKVFDFTAHMKDPDYDSSSQAFLIDVSGPKMIPESIFLDKGDLISGASVAAKLDNQLLVGAVFEPHFVRCVKEVAKN